MVLVSRLFAGINNERTALFRHTDHASLWLFSIFELFVYSPLPLPPAVIQVHQAVPQLLLPVLPHLCMQMEAEEDARRLGAVVTAGHLFSSADAELASEYPELLTGFLRRLVDQKVIKPGLHLQGFA